MRRAVVIVLASLALVAALAGCGTNSTTPTTRADGTPQQPLQAANGPVAASPGTRPLTLQLTNGQPDPVQIRFGRQPRSGLMFDLDTGKVLWRKDPERILPIASVTKMMTALVVTDHVKQGSKVLVTKQALAYRGSGVGVLPRGKWIGVSAMLYGLLLPSGNDAAIALAQRTAHTVPAFVAMMNERAHEMGLTCTHYSSPSGYYDANNHSCAADLAVEARAVLDNPRIATIVKHRSAVLPFPIKGGRLYLYNHNELLKDNYPGTIGIKTGYTYAAGMCLVAAVQRNGHRLGVVLLHSPNPGQQAEKLFNAGFKAIG